MNANRHPSQDFQSVAQRLLDEQLNNSDSDGVLRRYIERYPEFTEELLMLAIEMAVSEDDEIPVITPPSTLYERLRASTQDVRDPDPAELAPEMTFGSLLDFAEERCKLDPTTLASTLDLTVDILALLDERRLHAASIYPAVHTMIAERLGVSPSVVQAYFREPSRIESSPAGEYATAYHAPDGLTQPILRTFAQAIEESPLMTSDQKERWRTRAP